MKNRTNICLASDDSGAVLGLTPEAVAAMKENAPHLQAFFSAVDDLDEPLKSKFNSVKEAINKALAGLPESDKVPAALDANYVLRSLLSTFSLAQEMMATMQGKLKSAEGKASTAMASITTEVENAVNDKIAKGELLTKADHDAAVTKAGEDAKASLIAGQKLVADRRTALASAKLPVPGEDVLSADDEAFKAKETEAKARIDKLAPFNLPAERLTLLAWNTDQAVFDTVVATLAEAPAIKKGGNPFVPGTPAPAAPAKPDHKKFGAI